MTLFKAKEWEKLREDSGSVYSVAIILGTGPSLTHDVINTVYKYRFNTNRMYHKGIPPFLTFGVNNVYQVFTPLDFHYACNVEWWDHYYHNDPALRDSLLDGYTEHFTWNETVAERYGANLVEGRWSGGKRNVTSLSQDPDYINFGHGAGYEVLGLAYNLGVRTFILAGYDLRYPRGYDAAAREPGGKRHFFGEYPPGPLRHFPGGSGRNVAPDGSITGLLDCYRTIDTEQLGLRIINTSPGSALDFFEVGDLNEVLETYA